MIGAAIGAAGGSLLNYVSTERTNRQNKDMSREQMAWQERMSNTAHQREVKDLVKAGINPNLTAGGSGSSTPTGSMPNLTAPQVDVPGLVSAMQLTLEKQKVDNDSQRVAIDKESSAAQIAKNLSDKDLNKMKTILAQKGMPRAMLEGKAAEQMNKIIKLFENQKEQPKRTKPFEDEALSQKGMYRP